MSEQVLYRKYRPSSFDEVRGQDHIVSVLKESLKGGGVSHAYLFAGTRGTGKTSIARILAKEIGTDDVDIYEIDAASHTGVDDIRQINEAVTTLPYRSEKKVYIIDEVHMLSKSAFNALLKTLEEPPAHILFVLATTEMHKLPDTVISRCEVHRFRKPSQKELLSLIVDVSKKEGREIDNAGQTLIALLGDGSYRDTLGVLQKVLRSTTSTKISHEEVESLTSAPSLTILNDVLDGLHRGDLNKALSELHRASEQNVDMKVFLSLLLARLRSLLLIRHAPDIARELKDELGEEGFAYLKKRADDAGSQISSEVLRELLTASSQTRFASIPHLPIELALMRILESSSKNSETQSTKHETE